MSVRSVGVAVGVVLLALSGLSGPATAQSQPRRVLVYGDSLTWEAQAGITSAIERELPGWQAIATTFPGSAICDWIPAMRRDSNQNAGVVVMEFVGVALSSCMHNRAQVEAMTADLNTALALWASRGVPVVLVGAPNGVGQSQAETVITTLMRTTAASTGQTFVDAGALLRDPWTGIYQARLECLAGESAAQGCGADNTTNVRDAAGGHFCSISNVGPCPVYASGIVRFAAPIAAAVARAAGQTPHALPAPAPVPGAREAARSLW